MFKVRSIIWRILAFHIIAILIATLLFAIILVRVLGDTAERLEYESFQSQARALAKYLAWDPQQKLTINLPAELQAHFSELYGRYSYEVLDESGNILLRSGAAAQNIQSIPFSGETNESSFFVAPNGRVLSHATILIDAPHGPLWIRVAEDLSHRDALQDDLIREFLPRIAWIAAGIFTLMIIVDTIMVKRAFRPLAVAALNASQVRPGQPDLRLQRDSVPPEVQAFVDAVDEAFNRLESGYQVQRQFASDAAHELRTPLAVLRMRIDMVEDRAIRQPLIRDVEQMTRTVNEFIELAEIGSMRGDPLGTVDLNVVAKEVVEQLDLLALRAGKILTLSLDEEGGAVIGNPDLIFSAIRNLVENAIRLSPEETTVEISVQGATVDVRDQGPGIPDDVRDKMFNRLWRADKRKSGASGLGLSIVRQIVDIHGGSIVVAARQDGGSSIKLQFRPAVG